METNAVIRDWDEDNAMTVEELRQALRERQTGGETFADISAKTGVHRSTISQLVNQNVVPKYEHLFALQQYVRTVDAGTVPTGYKQEMELWQHEEYLSAMGWCDHIVRNRKMGVMIGQPGTGKTTILKSLMGKASGCIYIEAMPNMRVGDLFDAIADGAGITTVGSCYRRFNQLVAGLQGRRDIVILIDEAEYLRKWNVEKFEYLRKIWDNTDTPVIMVGTLELEKILTRGRKGENLAQLYRRKYELQLMGISYADALNHLRRYNLTTDAGNMLAKISTDVKHGGLGTMCEILDMCLVTAAGGTITAEMVTAAKRYKLMSTN